MKKSGVLRISIGILAFLIIACESLYIRDPIDPRLPKYTDQGNGVGGALVNGRLWKSVVTYNWIYEADNRPTLHYYADQDSLGIVFNGEMDGDEYVQISFGLSDVGSMDQLASMEKLKGKKFQLGTEESMAVISTCTAPASSGQLYFRSIEPVPESQSVILSGTFGFTILDPACGDKEITYGRFDFEVFDMN